MDRHEGRSSDGRGGIPSGPGKLRPLLLGGALGAALTCAAAAVLWWPRAEVVHRTSAPASVTYPDKSPHHLGLVRERTLAGRESWRLVVGRDPGLSYGHMLDVDAALAAEGVDATEWTKAGVRVRFEQGHELFVPAWKFTHGR